MDKETMKCVPNSDDTLLHSITQQFQSCQNWNYFPVGSCRSHPSWKCKTVHLWNLMSVFWTDVFWVWMVVFSTDVFWVWVVVFSTDVFWVWVVVFSTYVFWISVVVFSTDVFWVWVVVFSTDVFWVWMVVFSTDVFWVWVDGFSTDLFWISVVVFSTDVFWVWVVVFSTDVFWVWVDGFSTDVFWVWVVVFSTDVFWVWVDGFSTDVFWVSVVVFNTDVFWVWVVVFSTDVFWVWAVVFSTDVFWVCLICDTGRLSVALRAAGGSGQLNYKAQCSVLISCFQRSPVESDLPPDLCCPPCFLHCPGLRLKVGKSVASLVRLVIHSPTSRGKRWHSDVRQVYPPSRAELCYIQPLLPLMHCDLSQVRHGSVAIQTRFIWPACAASS